MGILPVYASFTSCFSVTDLLNWFNKKEINPKNVMYGTVHHIFYETV